MQIGDGSHGFWNRTPHAPAIDFYDTAFGQRFGIGLPVGSGVVPAVFILKRLNLDT